MHGESIRINQQAFCAVRILFYIPNMMAGGPNRVIHQLANTLSGLGHTIAVCVDKPEGRYWSSLAPEVERIAVQSKYKYPIFAFSRVAKEWRPDFVVATLHSCLTASYAKLFFGGKYKLLIRPALNLSLSHAEIMEKHPIKHRISYAAVIGTLHVADGIVAQSSDLADDFTKNLYWKKPISVIGNPIDVELNLENDKKNIRNQSISAVGRLVKQKNFSLLISAFHSVSQDYADAILRIYGTGPEENDLRKLIAELNLEDRVKLMGHGEDIHGVFRSSSFSVSSSEYEGFPNVVLESLAEGCPVVATNCHGGTRDMVIPGLTGWLCQPGSKSCMEITLKSALSGTGLDSNEIKKFVDKTFSSRVISEKYIAFMTELSDSHG